MTTLSRSGTYQIRINNQEKQETFAILHDLGITPAQAVKMFFAQVRNTRSIPFNPNLETIKAIKEARSGENLIICKDSDELFRKLGI